MNKLILLFIFLSGYILQAQTPAGTRLQKATLCEPSARQSVFLRAGWQMKKASDTTGRWYPAIVPGTVLNSLVHNGLYPEPYYGDNNSRSRKLIPDMADAGREFYHYWFRTRFTIPNNFTGKRIWLKLHGINYRCTIWCNGKQLGVMAGMFNTKEFDITAIAKLHGNNELAIDVQPVDIPGNSYGNTKSFGAKGENRNGGDGEIGRNVTMLMSVGWDFTFNDGIRDRNTGIWRDVELYTTGDVVLQDPFVSTQLPLPDTSVASQTIAVELFNASDKPQQGMVSGVIKEAGIRVQQPVSLAPHEKKLVRFEQIQVKNPKLWWPLHKGAQHLYTLLLRFQVTGAKNYSHEKSIRYGIRTITSNRHTPDSSRRFYVNGHPVFIRGSNWIPEAMLRNSEQRTYAELRYTRQAGINLLRLWGGGIAESDYFYQLCDEYGILVWNEFWITGDTRFPSDTALYIENLSSTVKRLRNHAALAYYVSSNESTEIPGAREAIRSLDSSRGYQMQSECCGIHDGSPYRYENPMQYYENTASPRGSRVDGFNPEYGTPCLPIVESLREMMPAKDCWPINDTVWKYLDGGGFHQMTTKYRQAVNEYGASNSIEEFAKKAQFVGAMNYRAIWEVWNYNKFQYGDRFASGFLFWYHNSPVRQTAGRLYDWSLEPTAALYYSQNALAPLHPQFDYLKNTVSVYNDYRQAFAGYSVMATVYDLHMRKVWQSSAKVQIPADGVANDVMKINFPDTITQVHFIKLQLLDDQDRLVQDAFYWRSKDAYKGAWTLTGPAVSGFNDINKLPLTNLQVYARKKLAGNKVHITVAISNTTTALAFFTQLKIQTIRGQMIRPAFYSDNFFSLLPGESKNIIIEFEKEAGAAKHVLRIDGWNVQQHTITL
jgi:hypothetical protein